MSVESEIMAALEAIDPPVFRVVAGAADFGAVGDKPHATPAAYVITEEEVSEASSRATGPVLQRTEMDIAVVIITSNLSDLTGGAAAGDIVALKHQVRRALVGLVPAASEDGTPVTHLSGAMLKAKGGYVWWRELYAASTYTEES